MPIRLPFVRYVSLAYILRTTVHAETSRLFAPGELTNKRINAIPYRCNSTHTGSFGMTSWIATTVEDPASSSTSASEAEKSKVYLDQLAKVLGSHGSVCTRQVKSKFFWEGKVDVADELRIEVALPEKCGHFAETVAKVLKPGEKHPYDTPMLLGSAPQGTEYDSAILDPAGTVVQLKMQVPKGEESVQKFQELADSIIGARKAACIQFNAEDGVLFLKTSSGKLAEECKKVLMEGYKGATVEGGPVISNNDYMKWLKEEVKSAEEKLA